MFWYVVAAGGLFGFAVLEDHDRRGLWTNLGLLVFVVGLLVTGTVRP